MIKVINLVSLIIAPIIVNLVRPGQGMGIGVIIAMVLCVVALAWAIWQSKRESDIMSSDVAVPPATTASGD